MTTVLLHGLGSDGRFMLDQFGPALAETAPGDVVIAPDVRAHGTSTLIGEPTDFALEQLTAEIEAEIEAAIEAALRETDAEPGAPVTLIGVSMGAALALRIALGGRMPVRRALFVRPSFSDEPSPPNLRAFPVIGQLLHDAGPTASAQFRETALYREALADSPLGAAGLLAQFGYPDAAARAVRLVEIPRNRAFTAESELGTLAARGIQTAVVGAPRDPVHPFPVAERWAGALGAPLTRLPARDDGQAAQTAALRSATADWLSAVDG